MENGLSKFLPTILAWGYLLLHAPTFKATARIERAEVVGNFEIDDAAIDPVTVQPVLQKGGLLAGNVNYLGTEACLAGYRVSHDQRNHLLLHFRNASPSLIF